MKRNIKIITIILAISLFVTIFIFLGPGRPPEEVRVPIQVNNADNVGSLHIELSYNEKLLQIIEIVEGKLSNNSIIEANIQTPGRIVIGVVNPHGINGDGAIVEVSYKILVQSGVTSVDLENVCAHEASSLFEIIDIESLSGSIDCRSGKIAPPTVVFNK